MSPQALCLNVDPTTGAGVATGGIAMPDTLSSVGKTLGIDPITFDEQLTDGQVIQAILR